MGNRKHKLRLTDDEAMEEIKAILQEADRTLSSGQLSKQIKQRTGVNVSPQFIGNLLSKKHSSHHIQRVKSDYNYRYRLNKAVIYP